jgi:hypothetical protein
LRWVTTIQKQAVYCMTKRLSLSAPLDLLRLASNRRMVEAGASATLAIVQRVNRVRISEQAIGKTLLPRLEKISFARNPIDRLAAPFFGSARIFAHYPNVADDHEPVRGFEIVLGY